MEPRRIHLTSLRHGHTRQFERSATLAVGRAVVSGNHFQKLWQTSGRRSAMRCFAASNRRGAPTVASGDRGYRFHQHHRVPGAHAVARRQISTVPVGRGLA
jgi:hypothetical protein